MKRASHLLAAGALLAALAPIGCYAGSAHAISPHQVAADPDWIVVRQVPLIRQEGRSDCGAAALAMVMSFWSHPTTVAQLDALDPAATAQGWRAGRLRDVARQAGLQAFVVKGGLDDLSNELRRGHPVVVGLVQRYGDRGRAHYEVIVGIHPKKRLILSLDPGKGWREDSLEGFAREWVLAQQVTLVVFPPAAAPDASAHVPAAAVGNQRRPGAS